jgi:sporulation protein YlmC with PRC-barrel domain
MANSNDPIVQVREDMDVYCSDGEKIGEVGDINIGTLGTGEVTGTSVAEEQSYFQVKRGFLGLGDDLYFTSDQIQAVGDDRVTLACASTDAESVATTDPPATPGPGGTGTDTSDAAFGGAAVAGTAATIGPLGDATRGTGR